MISADLRPPTHSRDARRPDVQGLRAVAILMVVLYHAQGRLPGGFTGVDVFFVISGFVIARVLLADLERTGGIDFLRFYGRRARRILPALAAIVLFVAIVGTLAAPAIGQRTTAVTGMWASVFAANAYLVGLPTGYFATSTTYDALLHTWTLAVEEQFYLVFPVLLLLGWRLRARVGAFAVVAIVAAASFALSLSGEHDLWAFYLSPTRAWEFGVGALVAVGEGRLRRLPRGVAEVVGVCGALAVVEAGHRILDTNDFPGTHALLPVLGAAAVIAAGAGAPTLASRVLALRPLTFLGDVSYSWYLWHWPLIVFARACLPSHPAAVTIAAAGSLLPAWLSLRYVENPIRFGTAFRGRRTLVLAGLCVAVPLAASGGLLGVHGLLGRTTSLHAWEHARAFHADFVEGCDSATPLGARRLPACVERVAESRGTVLLLGDSNAGHFTEPFRRAADRAGFNSVVATLSGCPFVLLEVDSGARSDACRRFVTRSLATVQRRRPSLVVLAARVDAYVDTPTENAIRSENGGPVVRAPAAKARLWGEALRATVAALTGAGVPVVVVEPVPRLPLPTEGCAVARILLTACAVAVPRAQVDRNLAAVVRAQRTAVAGNPAASRVSFEDAICDRETCSSMRDGVVLYRDGGHLSVDGSLTLTDRFYRLMLERARPLASPG